MKIGTISVIPVHDGLLVNRIPATKSLPDVGTPAWQDQGGAFRHDGQLVSTIGGFLVHSGDRLILVDTGAGEDIAGGYIPPTLDVDDPNDELVGFFRSRGIPEENLRQLARGFSETELRRGELPASLAALGVRPDDVTDLVFTHLHFDHIGWASTQGKPFFPNATVRCSAADLEYFLSRPSEDWFSAQFFRTPIVADRLGPVLDRITTWESDGPILPGLSVRLAPGHTPGSSVVVISSDGQNLMVLGDVVHCPLELMDDDFNLLGDHDQQLANRVRESYARELEKSNVLAAACHFPGLRFGRLLGTEAGRRWRFDDAL